MSPHQTDTAPSDLLFRLLPLYRQDTNGMDDATRNAFLDERERLTWAVAQEPGATPADIAAKLAILCTRLRRDLGQACLPGPVADYLLAESIRADVDGMGEVFGGGTVSRQHRFPGADLPMSPAEFPLEYPLVCNKFSRTNKEQTCAGAKMAPKCDHVRRSPP